MSFFDLPEGERRPRPLQPERLHAPDGPAWLRTFEEYYLPAVLPWSLELGRSADTVVALRGLLVWPDGCTLHLMLFSQRSLVDGPRAAVFGFTEASADPDGLRFGVQFSDGRRGTNQGSWSRPFPDQDPPAGPLLRPGGGEGSRFHYNHGVHVWPLPPDGPLTLVVEWPERDIAETRTELDGSAIRAAAAGAVEIWTGLPPAPEGTAFTSTTTSVSHSSARTSSSSAAIRRDPEPPED